MNANSVLTLPKYKLVSTGGRFLEPGVTAQAIPLSLSYDWTGRPIANNPLYTPIAYHRGSWLALGGIDPGTTTAIPNSAYWPGHFDSSSGQEMSALMRNIQHGQAFAAAKSGVRVPTTILYNCLIAKASQAFGWAPWNNNGGPTGHSELDAMSLSVQTMIEGVNGLEAANALVALMDPSNVWYAGQRFLGIPYPASGSHTVNDTWSGSPITNENKVVDESRFVGGNLLVLSGIIINMSGSGNNASDYYDVSCFGSTVSRDNVATNLIADDLDIAKRCYSRFRRFQHYIYAIGSRTSSGSALCANTVYAHMQDAVASAAAYGVSLRGLYDQAVNDLTSQVQTDVATFLAAL
jgi:hypothetical protein